MREKKKAESLSHARDEWIITASFSLVLDRSIGKRRRKMPRIITMRTAVNNTIAVTRRECARDTF
jgi:hypothetical protein